MFRFLMMAMGATLTGAYTLNAMPLAGATARAGAPSMVLSSNDAFRQGTGSMRANRNGNGGQGWTGEGAVPGYGYVKSNAVDGGKDAFAFSTGSMAANRNGNGGQGWTGGGSAEAYGYVKSNAVDGGKDAFAFSTGSFTANRNGLAGEGWTGEVSPTGAPLGSSGKPLYATAEDEFRQSTGPMTANRNGGYGDDTWTGTPQNYY